jgi:hypothetical protein
MRLDQAFDGIMDAVVAKLEAARAAATEETPAGLLADVQSIVRGDRARGRPDEPAIWVYAETANVRSRPTTIREGWELPLALVAIVKNDNPEEGYNEASRLSALARHVVLRDANDRPERTFGLAYVQDTRSGRYEPSGPWHRDGNLFASVAVVVVTFITDD